MAAPWPTQLSPPNVTVNIYRTYNAAQPVPNDGIVPDVAPVQGLLKHHMKNGRFGNTSAILHWTHLIYLPYDTDVRDAFASYLAGETTANADTILIADYPLPGRC